MTLPILVIPEVMHLGFLRERPAPKISHEGRCLSVSLHPDAWRRIARLGGSPLWALEHAQGRFVDFYALTAAHHQEALAWARNKQWLREEWLYHLEMTDEDGEVDGYVVFESYDEALDESDDCPERIISRVRGHVACDAMQQALGISVPLGFAERWATIEWLADTSDADGIWWDDMLDPSRFSAPRGGIFQHRVQRWTKSCLRQD